jgi:hypothetical protein
VVRVGVYRPLPVTAQLEVCLDTKSHAPPAPSPRRADPPCTGAVAAGQRPLACAETLHLSATSAVIVQARSWCSCTSTSSSFATAAVPPLLFSWSVRHAGDDNT